MIYADTSLLVACYCPEAISSKAQALFQKEEISMSDLTEVEFSSALSLKVRVQELSLEDAQKVLALFEGHVHGDIFKRIPVEQKHYQLARTWINQFRTTLRTLDSLHLSIASMGQMVLATTDKALAKSAKVFGVSVTFVS